MLGPESSGTRMLTTALTRAGVYGEGYHVQAMDNLDFTVTPDTIVYRNSVPHARLMPQIVFTCEKMRLAGYDITALVTDREDKFLELSQVKRLHQPTVADARNSIAWARDYIDEQLKIVGIIPILVQYEDFVGDADYRKSLFEKLDLSEPAMQFYDANAAYQRVVYE